MRLKRVFFLSLITLMASLLFAMPVLAIPQLPSSFYGKVKVNGANVPDGTSIQAIIAGHVYGEWFSQTYQGDSVYALDVSGDDPDTAAQDGGREGDTIQFKIGGVMAVQTGVWHSGTNVNVDLTASTLTPIATPDDTPTPVPTQTPFEQVRPSPTFTPTNQASSTPAPLVDSSPTPASLVEPSPVENQPAHPSQTAIKTTRPAEISTAQMQPPSVAPSSEKDNPDDSGFHQPVLVSILTVVVAIILGFVFLVSRNKNK
jgi:hypothetical protein